MCSADAGEESKTTKLIQTKELLRRGSCTRNQLARIRDQYPQVQPLLTVGNGAHLWGVEMIDIIQGILDSEQRERRG